MAQDPNNSLNAKRSMPMAPNLKKQQAKAVIESTSQVFESIDNSLHGLHTFIKQKMNHKNRNVTVNEFKIQNINNNNNKDNNNEKRIIIDCEESEFKYAIELKN